MWLILPSCMLFLRYNLGRGRKEGNCRLCCCVAGKGRHCNQIWSVETWDGNSRGKLGRYITLFHATLMAKCVAEFSSTSPASHLALEQCNIPWGSKQTHPHLSVPPSHQLTPLLKLLEDECSCTNTTRNNTERERERVPGGELAQNAPSLLQSWELSFPLLMECNFWAQAEHTVIFPTAPVLEYY